MSTEHCQCNTWCNTYGMPQPGEYHHRGCKRWYRQHKGAEVFQTHTELIVTGDPDEGDESHNCDAMGCTSVSHVLFRLPLAAAPQPAQAERALHQSWYAHPAQAEPEFTDTARGALLWVLWHHQGSSSQIGQPIRFVLGMDAHERLSDEQVERAKRWGELTGSVPGTCRAAQAEPQREALAEEAHKARRSACGAWSDIISGKHAVLPVDFEERCDKAQAAEKALTEAIDRLARG